MKEPKATFNQIAMALFSVFVAVALTMTVVSVVLYTVEHITQ